MTRTAHVPSPTPPAGIDRRAVLGFLGFGSLAVLLDPQAAAFAGEACTPAEPSILGPFFVDELLDRVDIRVDPFDGSIQPGVPLELRLTVEHSDLGCTPAAGVQVDVWHASAQGLYSDEASLGTEGRKYLRGYQISDANGAVRFTTIFPGPYTGRTFHVHVRLRTFDGAIATFDFVTQIYFDEVANDAVAQEPGYAPRDTTNAEDGFIVPSLIASTVADGSGGYVATMTLSVPGIPASGPCPTEASIEAAVCQALQLTTGVSALPSGRLQRRLERSARSVHTRLLLAQTLTSAGASDRRIARVLTRARSSVRRVQTMLGSPSAVAQIDAAVRVTLTSEAFTLEMLLMSLLA